MYVMNNYKFIVIVRNCSLKLRSNVRTPSPTCTVSTFTLTPFCLTMIRSSFALGRCGLTS